MSKLIALCDGHGMETPGKRTPYIPELGRFVKENEFNRAVVRFLDAELKRCGFRTILVAPTDADTPLATRIKIANDAKADAYVSVHYDAFDGKFDNNDPEGITVFVYTGQSGKEAGRLAKCVLNHLKQGTPQKNRGVKEANYAVLRDTKMIAILSENGFMDNKREALLMVEEYFQKEVAIEHCKGLCDYFKVPYVPGGSTTPTPAPTPAPPVSEGTAESFLLEVIVNGLHTYRTPNWNDKTGPIVNKGDIFTVVKSLVVNGSKMYQLKSGVYITANTQYVKRKTAAPTPAPVATKQLTVLVNGLHTYRTPNWNDKTGPIVKKGDVFTVVDTITVNGSKMHELKSGLYITANTQYVRLK